MLHGAFYYGCIASQIPSGWVAHRIGAKIPVATGMLMIGILTVLSPLAADLGVWVFFGTRLLVGIFSVRSYHAAL